MEMLPQLTVTSQTVIDVSIDKLSQILTTFKLEHSKTLPGQEPILPIAPGVALRCFPDSIKKQMSSLPQRDV